VIDFSLADESVQAKVPHDEGRMRTKRYALAATLLAFAAAGQSGCTTKTCAGIKVNYDIAIDREMDAPFRDSAQFSVEVCGDDRCRSATVSAITHELAGDIRGSMVALDQGRTRVRAVVVVGENDTTSLTLRVRDKNGNLLLESRAPLQWKSGECHGEPVTTAI
jgi:hypothetical protein